MDIYSGKLKKKRTGERAFPFATGLKLVAGQLYAANERGTPALNSLANQVLTASFNALPALKPGMLLALI